MADAEILPPPVRIVNAAGLSPYVLVCEHASRLIPASYDGLGLSEPDLARHIAWDIGAAVMAEHMAQQLDAPLVLASVSRLIIDLNRPPNSSTSIPVISEDTVIPGNLQLTDAQRQIRIDTYFLPFHDGVRQVLDARQAAGKATKVIGVHSFTPVFKTVARTNHAGILFRKSVDFGRAFVEALGGAKAKVVENEPYQIEDDSDYTVPVHGEARGLDAVLVEIRQDLIADEAGAIGWAEKLSTALTKLAREAQRPA